MGPVNTNYLILYQAKYSGSNISWFAIDSAYTVQIYRLLLQIVEIPYSHCLMHLQIQHNSKTCKTYPLCCCKGYTWRLLIMWQMYCTFYGPFLHDIHSVSISSKLSHDLKKIKGWKLSMILKRSSTISVFNSREHIPVKWPKAHYPSGQTLWLFHCFQHKQVMYNHDSMPLSSTEG